MDAPSYLQTLLSSHGGVDSEDSLTAIIKQLKATRERVRNECVNVFSKGYGPFLHALKFVQAQQEAEQSKSKVSLEMKFREMDGPTLQKHIVLSNAEYLGELYLLLRQFDALGFPHAITSSTIESPLPTSVLSSASSAHTQVSAELALPVPTNTIEKRPVSIVAELVTSVGERLKVLKQPENGRHLLVDQEKIAFLDERGGEWRSVRLFLLTDALIIGTKKSKLATTLTTTRKQYALERLVLLGELKIINYQDNERIQNAWRLEHGASYGIFQCDSPDTKTFLIQAIYDAKNALLGRGGVRKAAAGGKKSSSKTAEQAIEEKEYHVEEKTPSFTRRYLPSVLVNDLWSQMLAHLAELRGHVAVMDYELASVVIERLHEMLDRAPECPETLKIKDAFEQLVGDLKAKLLGKIARLASSAPLLTFQPRAIEEIIQAKAALEHMGAGEEAQDAFLDARLHLLHNSVQQLKLGSGTQRFLQDFCHLNTCLLKETGAVFAKAFGANTGFLFWLRIQIKEMASTVSRILLSKTQHHHQTANDCLVECIQSACKYATEMSGNVGIDTGYEFKLAFEPFLSDYLQRCSQMHMKTLCLKLDNGDFDIHEEFSEAHTRLNILGKILLK